LLWLCLSAAASNLDFTQQRRCSTQVRRASLNYRNTACSLLLLAKATKSVYPEGNFHPSHGNSKNRFLVWCVTLSRDAAGLGHRQKSFQNESLAYSGAEKITRTTTSYSAARDGRHGCSHARPFLQLLGRILNILRIRNSNTSFLPTSFLQSIFCKATSFNFASPRTADRLVDLGRVTRHDITNARTTAAPMLTWRRRVHRIVQRFGLIFGIFGENRA
jgi:hypothetical protein